MHTTKAERIAFNEWARNADFFVTKDGPYVDRVVFEAPEDGDEGGPVRTTSPVAAAPDGATARLIRTGLVMAANAATDLAHVEMKLASLAYVMNADAMCWPATLAPQAVRHAVQAEMGALPPGPLWRVTPALAQVLCAALGLTHEAPDPEHVCYVICWAA